MENHSKLEKFNQAIFRKIEKFLIPFFAQIIKFDLKKIEKAETLKTKLLSVLTPKEQSLISKLIPTHFNPFNTDKFLSCFGYYNELNEPREFILQIRERKVLIINLESTSKLINQASFTNPVNRGLTKFLNRYPIDRLDENKYFQISCGAVKFSGRLSKSTIRILKDIRRNIDLDIEIHQTNPQGYSYTTYKLDKNNLPNVGMSKVIKSFTYLDTVFLGLMGLNGKIEEILTV